MSHVLVYKMSPASQSISLLYVALDWSRRRVACICIFVKRSKLACLMLAKYVVNTVRYTHVRATKCVLL